MMLLNATMAAGLASAAVPIIIHIAHRRKYKSLHWGAMRFLYEVIAKSRRRLFIEEWLLLAVRVLAVLALALALTRPAIQRGPAEGLSRIGRTAAVILFDDSASSGVRLGESDALSAMRALALAYMDTLTAGDEVSVLRLSRLHEPPSDPLFDLPAARSLIEGIQTTEATTDIPGLLEAGLARLVRHLNPGAEIVLVTDGVRSGWRLHERARWAELRRRLMGSELAAQGTRARPRVLLLAPQPGSGPANATVSDLELDRTLIAPRTRFSVRVGLAERGDVLKPDSSLRLLVDGRQLDARRLDTSDKHPRRELAFSLSFDEPGSHVIEAVLDGVRDAYPRDDRRALAVEVVRQIKVLLVEPQAPRRALDGTLPFVALALDPAGRNEDVFSVTRVAVSEISSTRLEDYRVVVLGDVEGLSPAELAAIERYVASGGGLLVGLGPRTRPELANRFWARGGDGLLPCPLGELRTSAAGEALATLEPAHPVLTAFGGEAAEAWKAGRVRRYYRLEAGPATTGELKALIALESGAPLLVERRRGLGRVAMFATALDMSWSDLPAQPAFVPLVRGLVSWLGGQTLPPRNIFPGERLFHAVRRGQMPQGRAAKAEFRVGPAGLLEDWTELKLEPGNWEGRPCLMSEPIQATGICRLTEGDNITWYAVSLHPDESLLEPLGREDIDVAFGEVKPLVLSQPEDVRANLDPKGRKPVEIWRQLVLLSVVMLFVETLLVRRQAISEGRQAPEGASGQKASLAA